jgi:hypothetical protein
LAGQPTAREIEQLAERRVSTVITLRMPDELEWDEGEVVQSAGIEFLALPLRSARDLTVGLRNEAYEMKTLDYLRRNGKR